MFFFINCSNTKFPIHYNLFKQLTLNNSDTTVFSGFSLREALVVPYHGASNGSQCQKMFSEMFESQPSNKMLKLFNQINQKIMESKKALIANSLWVSSD